MNASFLNLWIVIPTFNPDQQLVSVVKYLSRYEFGNIVIVNDGSDILCAELFKEVSSFSGSTILHHPENLGKGAALKTGINYFLENSCSDVIGLVCLDGDGQHLVEDVIKVSAKFQKNPKNLILGSRAFTSSVPWKSKIGNQLAKMLLAIFHNIKLPDTQTGLRGTPRSFAQECIKLPYNRYDFETACLIRAQLQKIIFLQVPISTLYFERNASSSFRPILDSIRILQIIIKEKYFTIDRS